MAPHIVPQFIAIQRAAAAAAAAAPPPSILLTDMRPSRINKLQHNCFHSNKGHANQEKNK